MGFKRVLRRIRLTEKMGGFIMKLTVLQQIFYDIYNKKRDPDETRDF